MEKNFKFKVGDKVKFTNVENIYDEFVKGDVGYIVKVDSEDDIWKYKVAKKQDNYGYEYDWVEEKHLVKYSGKMPKELPMKYILQYEDGNYQSELFATLPEVKTRIKEIAEEEDLVLDSIYVYEIKKTTKVEVTTTTQIKGL